MDEVFGNFDMSQLQAVMIDGPSRDLEAYLGVMAQLDERLAYFETNSSFQSSEQALKKLRRLKEKAVLSCEQLFSETLEKSSVPVDPATLPSPLPKELQLMEEETKRRVLLLDTSTERITGATDLMKKLLDKNVAKGKVDAAAAAAALARVVPTTDMGAFAEADFVVEAATEAIDLKLDIFRKLDAVARPGTILASNTSSISITKIAGVTKRPHDVIKETPLRDVPFFFERV